MRRTMTTETFRELLDNWTRAHMTVDGQLDLETSFSQADALLDTFLSTEETERHKLHSSSEKFVNPNPASIFRKGTKGKENKFKDGSDVKLFFNAFGRRCMVSGLKESDTLLAVDRIIDTDWYSWSTCILMSHHINLAKHLQVFSSDDAFDAVLLTTTFFNKEDSNITASITSLM